jgi:serine-type D-Ala-D-Ala carboxypeptidase (penicillin-binding protein 5/6)
MKKSYEIVRKSMSMNNLGTPILLSRVIFRWLHSQKGNILFFVLIPLLTLHFSISASGADEVRSSAAAVIDASNGRLLFAKNPDLRLPPASTTKLMTAIVVVENADLNHIVTVSRLASGVSLHRAGFEEGDRVTVEKLLYAALLASANDAAVALAEAVAGSEAKFVDLMNRKAIAIGAGNTKFINSNGLPGPRQYTTAYDLAKIMSYSLTYPKLKEIIGTCFAEIFTENGHTLFLQNTNKLLWSSEDVIVGKTGYTRKARHCFVGAAERRNSAVIVAVLGSPDRQSLWRDSEALAMKGFSVMANNEAPIIYIAKIHPEKLGARKLYPKKHYKSKRKRGGRIKAHGSYL